MENYLHDVMRELIDEALLIKKSEKTEFNTGLLTGYYEIISKLLNQADGFGLADALPPEIRDYEPLGLFSTDDI